METFCKSYLLSVARAYAAAENLRIATVSREFHGAAHFLEAFERGDVTITLRKYDEMLTEFRQRWPKGTKLPPAGTMKLKLTKR